MKSKNSKNCFMIRYWTHFVTVGKCCTLWILVLWIWVFVKSLSWAHFTDFVMHSSVKRASIPRDEPRVALRAGPGLFIVPLAEGKGKDHS